jgi:all-trans-8'-apo-beta-carotenal 15,15'-oxygenase
MTAIAAASQPKSYQREQWLRGYDSQPNEYDYWIDDVTGQIPPQLTGTLFRNGPGLLDIHGTPIHHPFDGDGMVCAFSFTPEGRVHFRNRYVRTEGYVQEQQAKKPLYRGVFGSQKLGGWLTNAFDLRLKNIANTNILYWGDKLLALWEAAEPHRLDPVTLDTLGLEFLEGLLKPGDSFSAHPRIDPRCAMDGDRPCLVNFAIKPGLSSLLTLFEFAPDGQLLRRHSHSVAGFSFIHDFAITPHYAIFFQSAVSFNPLPYLLGLRGAAECLTIHSDRPTRIILIPRVPPYDRVQSVEIQAGFVFHHGNAFERSDATGDRLVIDSICYDSIPQVEPNQSYRTVNFDTLAPGQLWRFEIDLMAQNLTKTRLNPRCVEFPVTHPQFLGRPYRYLYSGAAHSSFGNAPLQAIQKIDLQTGTEELHSFAPSGYVSEPIFVPDPERATAEDGGWLLVLVYQGDRHCSELVILDAQAIQRGAIATLPLRHHIPYGLHGSWSDRCFMA